MASLTRRDYIVLGTTAALVFIVSLLPPFPQPQEYHNFVDKREYFGIPHFGDVLTNVPFVIPAAMALHVIFTTRIKQLRTLSCVVGCLALGCFCTGVGSFVYHWNPSDESIVGDRLGMGIVFAAALAWVVALRISPTGGMCIALLGPWINVLTVFYWRKTDDLRAYALNQGLPFVLVPLILSIYPPRCGEKEKTIDWMLWVAWVCAIGVKVTERVDHQLYALTFHLLSGHSIHHLLAVAAAMYIAHHCRTYANECMKEGAAEMQTVGTDSEGFLPTHTPTEDADGKVVA